MVKVKIIGAGGFGGTGMIELLLETALDAEQMDLFVYHFY